MDLRTANDSESYSQFFCGVALITNVHSAKNIVFQFITYERFSLFSDAISSSRSDEFQWIFVSEILAKVLGQQQLEVNE
jgi:hypothetical protein